MHGATAADQPAWIDDPGNSVLLIAANLFGGIVWLDVAHPAACDARGPVVSPAPTTFGRVLRIQRMYAVSMYSTPSRNNRLTIHTDYQSPTDKDR